MLGDNDLEYHALSARKFRPVIIKDDCIVSADFKTYTVP